MVAIKDYSVTAIRQSVEEEALGKADPILISILYSSLEDAFNPNHNNNNGVLYQKNPLVINNNNHNKNNNQSDKTWKLIESKLQRRSQLRQQT